ncbi:MAG: NAD(P)-dependent oxidoreductase [Candidatus Dormibacteraeota bacterium]|nr:NAD(P)-dependent oxidoreductase [Candidatus Dormibacteraeota bacterium]MBO0745389.1 NAD(P)-dependent oxidoreductase [Candidatus Dormibacteraeota bacterium]
MRVALLGTGKMGTAIARRVAGAGHELVLWNRTRSRAEEVGVGSVAGTPEEAVRGQEVVLSILFGPESVRGTYERLEPEAGQVYCEMSTAGPELPGMIAPLIEERGAALLTCPIVGSLPAIEDGSATLLVGGDEAAAEKALPVLRAFSTPRPAGSREQAAALKLINNAMLGVTSAVAAELLNAGRRQGLDPERVFERLSGFVPYLNTRRRGYLDRDHSNPMFELDGMCKDLDLALRAAHGAGAALPVTAAAGELFALAAPQHAGDEMTAVIEVFGR